MTTLLVNDGKRKAREEAGAWDRPGSDAVMFLPMPWGVKARSARKLGYSYYWLRAERRAISDATAGARGRETHGFVLWARWFSEFQHRATMKLLRMMMLSPGPSDESRSADERVLGLEGEVAWELFRAGRARLEDSSDWAAANWVLQRAAASRGDGMSAIPAAGR